MVQELVDEVLEHSTILNALARAPQALLRSASPNKPVHISEQYKGQDLLVIAKQTEPDLDSNAAKQGVQESTSSAVSSSKSRRMPNSQLAEPSSRGVRHRSERRRKIPR